jgi:hypothetical protein
LIENPVAFTISLRQKLADQDNYPIFELTSDFEAAVGLLEQQLRVIEHLKARVISADALIEVQDEEISEHNVTLFNKEIEIFNLQSQFERLTEGKNN